MSNSQSKNGLYSGRLILPAPTPYTVCQRTKKPISIQFRLRKPSRKTILPFPDSIHLVVRLSINGKRDSGFLARERHVDSETNWIQFSPDFLLIPEVAWDKKHRQVRGRDQYAVETNRILARIPSDLMDIFARQQQRHRLQQYPQPTTDSVKYEYLTGEEPPIVDNTFAYPDSFLKRKRKKVKSIIGLSSSKRRTELGPSSPIQEVMAAFMLDIYTRKYKTGLIKENTYIIRNNALTYLQEFELSQTQAYQLTPYWLEKLHSFMLTRPKGNAHHRKPGRFLTPGTATRYCSYVHDALSWLVKQRLIKANPFGLFKDLNLPGYKTKEVYFLEPVYYRRLFDLKPPQKLILSHWWFRLICLTGLDYPDAVRYAEARDVYETTTPNGNPKIVIRRAKPPMNECNIPMVDNLFTLWNEVLGIAPERVKYTTFLLHLREIAQLIDFPKPLTTKIGRKTAGVAFLNDHSIQGVSNVLGHSTIATTERYYVKVIGYYVDNEIDAARRKAIEALPDMGQKPRPNYPFINIYKAS